MPAMLPYRRSSARSDFSALDHPTDNAARNADHIERNEDASADHKSALEIVVDIHGLMILSLSRLQARQSQQ
jgi:hypothetical protein